MHHALIFLTAAVGVDVGWQPVPGGGYEYIIQIEPEMLEALLEGREIESDIPEFLRDVRSYRIRVGTDVLPQDGPPPEMAPVRDGPDTPTSAAGPPDESEAGETAPDGPMPGEGATEGDEDAPGAEAGAEPEPSAEEPTPATDPAGGEMPAGDAGPAAESDPPAEGPAAAEDASGPGEGDEPSLEGPGLPGTEPFPAGAPAEDEPESGDPAPAEPAAPGSRYSRLGSSLDDRPSLDRPGAEEGEEATVPEPFVAEDGTRPIVNHAGYRQDEGREEEDEHDHDHEGQEEGPRPAAEDEAAAVTARPWLPFTLALLGLFASVGGNCYLGLLTWGFRGRYLQLLEERKYRRQARQDPAKDEAQTEADPR
jgi:hypothetical protein